ATQLTSRTVEHPAIDPEPERRRPETPPPSPVPKRQRGPMTTIRTRPETPVQTRVTAPRATDAPAADRFREALGRSAGQLVAGVEQVASLVPGGPVVTAAIRGAGGGVGSTSQGLRSSAETSGSAGADGSSTDGTTSMGSLADQSNQAMELLELQHALAMEQQRVQTISNVMKARHDSNKAVIGNLR
ncbi:MAG: hypothetical protein KC586_08850, partial [Myxococcales bacterium]|nr:hypothetical protein [Myxococcales bacterium]